MEDVGEEDPDEREMREHIGSLMGMPDEDVHTHFYESPFVAVRERKKQK